MNQKIDKTKPTIVCLHSLFLSPAMFADFENQVNGAANVIAPTFPGQVERVEEPNTTVTIKDCADDVLRVLDEMGVETFSIVGQSMGGDVALKLALRVPERIERMVLMGSSACAEPAEQKAQFEQMAEPLAAYGLVPDLADVVVTILLGASTLSDPDKKPLVDDVRNQLLKLPPNFIHAARGVIERESVVDLLPEITTPTLIVSGTEDPARPPAWSDEMFDGIPDCQLWRIKRVGHSPILEAPALVSERVIDFLGLEP